jgi:hypothetical protein
MAHAQKPDFLFRRKGRVHLNRRGRQLCRLLAAELCASAVVMLNTPYSHSFLQFSFQFPSRESACAITFQLDSTISFSIVKPTRCTIAQIYFILEQNSTCFGRSLRPSPEV